MDCSGTFYTGFNTGIQRAVRNILMHSKTMEKDYNTTVVPVITFIDRFVEVGLDDLSRRFYEEKKTAFDKLSKRYLKTERRITVFKYGDNTNKKIRTSLLGLVLGRLRVPLKNIFQTVFFGYLYLFKSFKFKTVKINANDLIFLSDVYWSFNVLSISNRYKAKKGAFVVTLIYDIIAATHPQFFDNLRVDIIIKHIDKMIDCSDAFVCDSKYSADELRNYIYHKKHDSIKKPIEYFYLGNDLSEKPGIRDLSIRDDIKNILKNKNTYLMVGTIKQIKNHLFVLDVFEEMWNGGFNGNLIIVGVAGWNCNNILERFKHSKYSNTHLFVYNDINDAELKYLYKNSKALVIASITEGFGFPLVEAARYNIKVFASDIPVFREIGGDYPTYFSLDSKNDLKQKIISFERVDKVLKEETIETNIKPKIKIASFSWDDSIDNLFNKLIKIYNA